MDILSLTIGRIADMVRKREISCLEICERFLDAVKERDGEINCYLHVNDKILEEAKASDSRLAGGGSPRALEGVPVAVKDNICVRQMPATCASRMLENFVPPYDATVIERLRDQGALILGKTNMDEFAFGSSTESSAFFTTRNPFDITRVPGGSSGGSAAAVGARLCMGALGSDTGGSIRQPAAFCGIVGFKPSYGVVSRYGLIAFASSLDQIGPMTRDVMDSCIIMNVISGRDSRDSTCLDYDPPDYTRFLREDLKGIRIGVPVEYFPSGIEDSVREKVQDAIRAAESLGAEVEEISLPHTGYGIAVYYIVATAEASSNLARFDGVKYGYRTPSHENLLEMYMNTRGEGFGREVKRRIMMGTYVLSSGYYDAYYRKAEKVRSLIRKDFEEAFRKVDVIFTPATPEVPFRIGEKKADPLKMYLSDIFTANVNLAGLPAITLPVGYSGKLPVGLQVIAPFLREDMLFKSASAIENHFRHTS